MSTGRSNASTAFTASLHVSHVAIITLIIGFLLILARRRRHAYRLLPR
jgi:hypothetical protein